VGFGRDSHFLSSLIGALRGLSCQRSFTALIFKNPQNNPSVGKNLGKCLQLLLV
jgi:hypothetical protein